MFGLVATFCHWSSARRASRALNEHRRGYDWAAGELLRGSMSVEQIEHYIECSDAFNHSTAFDDGAQAACIAWSLRK